MAASLARPDRILGEVCRFRSREIVLGGGFDLGPFLSGGRTGGESLVDQAGRCGT